MVGEADEVVQLLQGWGWGVVFLGCAGVPTTLGYGV
jgi:hypothetical protein